MKHIDNNGRRSRAVVANGAVYLGGQVANDWDGDITAQTRETLARIDAVLKEAGSSRDKLVQATIWLKTMDDYDAMNAVWDAWIDKERAPARMCGVTEMADERIRIEIIGIATC
ncbi:RidA family protein [Rhodobium gokarnense]|uniref:Enamine deaminase RidA (YjgF/YER057c/UK114 family) n=1 Tax=Rhodobium gokarnense TaxID=364296 RepID=A0ABT3H8I9_9HYPH|nr:RidA family protein [Rhodobium gokarnense]MCW2306696.1 enamine deaminase RidA (YjgF/YER057c/UK114 family) [Rhodobium gokarnense]